jgi:hypothetical protein
MRRYVLWLFAIVSLFFILSLTGCGGSSNNSNLATPAIVTLTPNATSLAMEVGSTLQFTAIPQDSGHHAVTVPVTYLSSNASVLTFVPSGGGLACAGSWNATAQICTPGSVGVTQVTAVANGVSSPAIPVYVHDHIDQISIKEICPIFPPPPNNGCGNNVPPPNACVTSVPTPGVQSFRDYEAHAFSNGVDITASVGSFNFQQVSGSVVTISTTASELNNNHGMQVTQIRATAGKPGITQVYASAGGTNSSPLTFETCLIQSINLQVGGNTNSTTFAVNNGGAASVLPVVLDSDTPPRELTTQQAVSLLTWASLSPANATVSASGVITGKAPGGSAITAACLPPNCNVGSLTGTPPNEQPVYASNTITGTVGGNTSTGTVYVTSSCKNGSNPAPEGCQPAILPISTNNNVIGARTILPSAPNSFVFSPAGTKAFLGSTGGLIEFTASTSNATVTQLNAAPGVVLAVSNDGSKVVVADTVNTPNQVFLVDVASGGITPLLISGATAAAFSPDNFKLYIAGTTASGSKLYVYSSSLALQAVPLTAPVQSISFYANGALVYLNGGAPSAITVYNVCDNSLAETVTTSLQPSFFQATNGGHFAIGLDPSDVQIYSSTLVPPSAPNTCPFQLLTSSPQLVNLGQATFTPLSMIVTSDSSRAYILSSNRSSVFVYNFGVNTVTAIPLTNSPAAVGGSLSADGSQLYVGGTDGAVHAVSTISGIDLQQITFPLNNNTTNDTLCPNVTTPCVPDLIAFQP